MIRSKISNTSRQAVEDLLNEDIATNITDHNFNSPILRLFDTRSNHFTIKNSYRNRRKSLPRTQRDDHLPFQVHNINLNEEQKRVFSLLDSQISKTIGFKKKIISVPKKVFSSQKKSSKQGKKKSKKKILNKQEMRMKRYMEKRKLENMMHRLKRLKMDTGCGDSRLRSEINKSSKFLKLCENYEKTYSKSKEIESMEIKRKRRLALDSQLMKLKNPLRKTIASLKGNGVTYVNLEAKPLQGRRDSLLQKEFLNKTYRKKIPPAQAKILEKRKMVRRRLSMEDQNISAPLFNFGIEKIKLFYKLEGEGEEKKVKKKRDNTGNMIFNAILTSKNGENLKLKDKENSKEKKSDIRK